MPPPNGLSSHCKITRWIVLQKARRHPEGLRLLVSTQFQDLFHSPPGVLFTFPSPYSFTIDHKIYLALGGGPPGFRQGSTCPVLLEKINIRSASLSHTRLSRPVVSHSNYSASKADFLPYGQCDSLASQERVLESSRALSWSFKISQPLADIRLSTYLPVINYQAKTCKVWALPISLATTLGIVCYFLFHGVLRCFSSPSSLSHTLYIQVAVLRHDS